MQLDPVKPGFPSAPRSISENSRQHWRQFAYVAQMHVSHALAIPEAQRFTLAFVKDAIEDVRGSMVKKLANLCFVNSEPVRIAGEFGYRCAMTPNDLQESIKISGWFGPASDGEKIDDLNEKFGPAFARLAHGLDQFL
jgi:hypothetical protein